MRRFEDLLLHPKILEPEEEVFISGDVKQVGWFDPAKKSYIELNPSAFIHKMSCTFRNWAVFARGSDSEYQVLNCAQQYGEHILFFAHARLDGYAYEALRAARPDFENRTGVTYAVARMSENSMFGIDKRFVPSATVALSQISHYAKILVDLGVIDHNMLQLLKEHNVWAILGMVSGNSAIQDVLLQTKAVNAAVNELFICGFGTILVICLILLFFNCVERSRGKPMFAVPISDAELLGQLEKSWQCGQHEAGESSKFLTLPAMKNLGKT